MQTQTYRLNFRPDEPTLNDRIYPSANLFAALDAAIAAELPIINGAPNNPYELAVDPTQIVGHVSSYSVLNGDVLLHITGKYKCLLQHPNKFPLELFATIYAATKLNDVENPIVKLLAVYLTHDTSVFNRIENFQLKIKPLNEEANKLYANHGHFHDGDGGLDVYVVEDLVIPAGDVGVIKLGIAAEPVNGKPYWLLPRSSISKTPLEMCNSVGFIDGGYRGELMAVVRNTNPAWVHCEDGRMRPNPDGPFEIEAGTRLFQIAAMDGAPISYNLVDALSSTTRGAGGFGSTGK